MARLGSEKRPIIARVHSDEKAKYVAETCAKHGWHYIIGFEPDKPEDISDLEKMLNPAKPIISNKTGRNDPCPCGSGKKFKKCCGATGSLTACNRSAPSSVSGEKFSRLGDKSDLMCEDSVPIELPPSTGRYTAADMQLSDHDLKQLDEDYLRSLPAEPLCTLSSKLLSDLKEAHDRLNQNPSNSSRPPSSRAPWEKDEETSQVDGEDDDVPQDAASDAAADRKHDDEAENGKQDKEQSDPKQTESRDTKRGRPGRREGAPGHSRTQQLPINAECVHQPETCCGCSAAL